jgi:hypothetical protein
MSTPIWLSSIEWAGKAFRTRSRRRTFCGRLGSSAGPFNSGATSGPGNRFERHRVLDLQRTRFDQMHQVLNCLVGQNTCGGRMGDKCICRTDHYIGNIALRCSITLMDSIIQHHSAILTRGQETSQIDTASFDKKQWSENP